MIDNPLYRFILTAILLVGALGLRALGYDSIVEYLLLALATAILGVNIAQLKKPRK